MSTHARRWDPTSPGLDSESSIGLELPWSTGARAFESEEELERDWEDAFRDQRESAEESHEEEAPFGAQAESSFVSGEASFGAGEDESYGFETGEHFCSGCGRSLDREEESVYGEAELAAEEGAAGQDEIAAEAELGMGELPFGEAESEATSGVEAFAARLGAEWSRRRNGNPTAAAMTDWLSKDYQETIEGARRRWGKKFGIGQFTVDAVTGAWMISREETMKFQLAAAGVRPLGNFAPPAGSVPLTSSTLIEDSSKAPVAPLTVRFAQELRRRYPDYVRMSNYRGHGGGQFNDRGYSLDLFIKGLDDRGFYPRDAAVKLLRAVNDAAAAVGAGWRIIYNDFSVADAVNRALGRQHVIFVGKTRKTGNRVGGLNWHGPSPLILHFHLDLAANRGASASIWSSVAQAAASGAAGGIQSKPPPAASASSSNVSSPNVVRFAQRVLNAVQRERLGVDGDPGPKTRAALERFRSGNGLGTGSTLDSATVLALAQRALEEIAQQSMFAKAGVRDSATDDALLRFKSQKGLAGGASLDAAMLNALADTLSARSRSAGGPAESVPASSAGSVPLSGPGGIDPTVVSRIETHRAVIERVAQESGVSPHLIRGIIAAESAGKATSGAGTRGYKGLMQCEREAGHLDPEVSVRCGAAKYKKFTASTRSNVRQLLRQSFDDLPETTRIRAVMAGYNAGPRTVATAMRLAASSGDATKWLEPEHYVRAVIATGAYNPVESVIVWCAKKGHITGDHMVADLARLSGKPADAIRSTYSTAGSLNVKGLAAALRPFLFKEKDALKNSGDVAMDVLRSRATRSLLCSAQFKQAHTPAYLDKVLRYKAFFAARH